MSNKPISAPLLPSTGYNGDLIVFVFVFYKCLFTRVYFGHPIKITFKLDHFGALKCWQQLCEMLVSH